MERNSDFQVRRSWFWRRDSRWPNYLKVIVETGSPVFMHCDLDVGDTYPKKRWRELVFVKDSPEGSRRRITLQNYWKLLERNDIPANIPDERTTLLASAYVSRLGHRLEARVGLDQVKIQATIASSPYHGESIVFGYTDFFKQLRQHSISQKDLTVLRDRLANDRTHYLNKQERRKYHGSYLGSLRLNYPAID